MKKYILLLMVLFSLPIFGQVRLSTMDSITTFAVYDYSYWNTLSGGAYLNRKVSWSALRTGMIDYIDGLANTWALKQTYSSGATFSAGANGTVTFSDTVLQSAGNWYVDFINPNTSIKSRVGQLNDPFYRVYAESFIIPNTEMTDSVIISYDDSTLTINKTLSVANLEVTASIDIPDSASFSGLALSQTIYQPANVSDSVIALSATASSIEIKPPGGMSSPGVEKITMTGAGDGNVLVITNISSDAIVFQDTESDGNLYLATDFTMGQWDSIMLMYNSKISKWIEISRSNN